MDIDYYYALGLKRTCSKTEILYALHKILDRFGMEKLNNSDTKRRLIAFEAYDVLSDPFWRALYDQFGGRAIKSGIFVDNHTNVKRYSYHGDIYLTYRSVYGSTNPYAHVITRLMNAKVKYADFRKLSVEKIPLGLTLNEIFFGALKRIDVPKSDGTLNTIDLQISKGLPADTEMVHKFTDGRTIIFVTNDLPHERFVRSGQDLIRTYNVSLKEMIFGTRYIIKTLDHRRLRVDITQLITPTYQKIIRNEGMPVYGGNYDERGDLILKFNIQLPRYYVIPENNDEVCKTSSDAYTYDRVIYCSIPGLYPVLRCF